MFDTDRLSSFPEKPGVYIMKDKKGKIIYVGKAVSLKNRVRSYFQSSKNLSVKVNSMVSKIDDIEYIITDSEVEALILECNLIKHHHPKYNVLLRDDNSICKKSHYERFPGYRLFANQKDGARYLVI